MVFAAPFIHVEHMIWIKFWVASSLMKYIAKKFACHMHCEQYSLHEMLMAGGDRQNNLELTKGKIRQ